MNRLLALGYYCKNNLGTAKVGGNTEKRDIKCCDEFYKRSHFCSSFIHRIH